MKLKTILFAFFVIFGLQQSNAQITKFMTTTYSVSEKTPSGKWGKWSKPEKVGIVISLDEKKNRIIVYSQEIQVYTIVKYEDIVENADDLIYPFSCSDNDGMPFTISIITRKKQGNRKQMYINQKDVILLYNIEKFKETKKK